ncbi:MAG: hypothetical protein JXB20_00665 [Bacilli bacterium]|nr:hypothetical protein [Bacilli bacterium]MBN2696010.1 hypothetical protein [Bacilli bacterium]
MRRALLEKLEPCDFSVQETKFSVENLLAYVVDSIIKLGIEPSFAYVCVGATKLFPDYFSLGLEFPEMPDARIVAEKLELGKAYITAEPSGIYKLTPTGKEIARDVSAELMKTRAIKPITKIKALDSGSISRNYSELQLTKPYSDYLLTKQFSVDALMNHFSLPLTQKREMRKYLMQINSYANTIGDKTMDQYTHELLKVLDGK